MDRAERAKAEWNSDTELVEAVTRLGQLLKARDYSGILVVQLTKQRHIDAGDTQAAYMSIAGEADDAQADILSIIRLWETMQNEPAEIPTAYIPSGKGIN